MTYNTTYARELKAALLAEKRCIAVSGPYVDEHFLNVDASTRIKRHCRRRGDAPFVWPDIEVPQTIDDPIVETTEDMYRRIKEEVDAAAIKKYGMTLAERNHQFWQVLQQRFIHNRAERMELFRLKTEDFPSVESQTEQLEAVNQKRMKLVMEKCLAFKTYQTPIFDFDDAILVDLQPVSFEYVPPKGRWTSLQDRFGMINFERAALERLGIDVLGQYGLQSLAKVGRAMRALIEERKRLEDEYPAYRPPWNYNEENITMDVAFTRVWVGPDGTTQAQVENPEFPRPVQEHIRPEQWVTAGSTWRDHDCAPHMRPPSSVATSTDEDDEVKVKEEPTTVKVEPGSRYADCPAMVSNQGGILVGPSSMGSHSASSGTSTTSTTTTKKKKKLINFNEKETMGKLQKRNEAEDEGE
jgi:hypothetical protein